MSPYNYSINWVNDIIENIPLTLDLFFVYFVQPKILDLVKSLSIEISNNTRELVPL